MHSQRLIPLLMLLLTVGPVRDARAQLRLEPAFPGLTFTLPVDLQHAGDGTNRLFVVEQAGVIRVFDRDAAVDRADVFLDIRDRVEDGALEEGLLGLAFHPNFRENGQFFVDYTAADPRRTVVARYRVDPDDPGRADPASEQVLLEVAQPHDNHNAGALVFGPDGYLYVTLGDGGRGGDPQESGQDPTTLLGSILRLDVDRPSGGRAYGIPADNPFVGNSKGWREEIYAYGFRNPWRISFDLETGRLWAGDVGQRSWEEVDVVERGGNHGWDEREGLHCFEPEADCREDGLVDPVWEYGREGGASITGGYVYRGRRAPHLEGRYLFADFASGKVWALEYRGAEDVRNEELFDTDLNIASFGTDQDGEVYLLAFDGRIYWISPVMTKTY